MTKVDRLVGRYRLHFIYSVASGNLPELELARDFQLHALWSPARASTGGATIPEHATVDLGAASPSRFAQVAHFQDHWATDDFPTRLAAGPTTDQSAFWFEQ